MSFMPPRAKRARGESKDDMLVNLRMEIDVSIARLQAGNVGAPCLDALLAALGQVRPLSVMMAAITQDQAATLAKSIATTNNIDHRLVNISKLVFAAHHASLQIMEQKITSGKEALRMATEWAVLASFASDVGQINWSDVHEKIMIRVRG